MTGSPQAPHSGQEDGPHNTRSGPIGHPPPPPPAEKTFCTSQKTGRTTFDLCTRTDDNTPRVWIARPARAGETVPCRVTGL